MKKGFILFAILIAFILTTLSVSANQNRLHNITLEKNNLGYNIILDSDGAAKVSKKTPSNDEMILELKGITSADTVNAIYKGMNDVDGLVIENPSPNKLRIYISAENIKNSTVMMNPTNGETMIVGEAFPTDKLLWVGFVFALFSVIFFVSKQMSEEDNKVLIKKDIKDREIEMYRKYRQQEFDFDSNTRKNMKMRSILKKIDRKIDERLTASNFQ